MLYKRRNGCYVYSFICNGVGYMSSCNTNDLLLAQQTLDNAKLAARITGFKGERK